MQPVKCKCGKKMERLDCKNEVWFCASCGRNYDGEWRSVYCDDAHAHSKACTIVEK